MIQHFNMFILVVISLFSCGKNKDLNTSKIDHLSIRGGDISFLPELRKSGITTYNIDGKAEDMLTTFKNEGMNYARLRIWNHPSNEHSSMEEVKAFSDEIKKKGMKVWITVHYSDWWADPGKQNKPKAWENIGFDALKDSVYQFTSKIMTEMNPELIQIGNEINHGLLWPDGHFNQLSKMKELLAVGIKAVSDHNKDTKIMLHYAGHLEADPFFTNLRELDYDIMGLSYYPFWHGNSLDSLQMNLKLLGESFGKDIVIAETAYPFTLAYNDNTNNVIGNPNQILSSFAPTVEGQKDFLFKIREIVSSSPKGIGFCYWAPEWVAFYGKESTKGSSWENQALWGFDNKALPSIKIFNE